MVVRTGSFTAAAKAMHVTQPAVTNHIRALEDYYGVALFRRVGRGVEPNELGRALAELSRQLFTLEQEATDLLQASKALRRGTLRIGADGPYILIPLVAAFRQRFPGVRVGLTIGNTQTVPTK
jgi:DNA-binding transcriptional LysR family regulator